MDNGTSSSSALRVTSYFSTHTGAARWEICFPLSSFSTIKAHICTGGCAIAPHLLLQDLSKEVTDDETPVESLTSSAFVAFSPFFANERKRERGTKRG